MTREKIEIAKGSIAPTQRRLWSSAIEKLQEAELSLQQMEEAQDSIAEFWSRFFHEGKSKFSNFQPWAGNLKSKWEKDELLIYLYQARHQSQHGRVDLDWDEGRLHIAPGFNGHIKNLTMFSDGMFSMDSSPMLGSEDKAKIRFEGGYARLPTITNTKTKQDFFRPMQHLDEKYSELNPIDAIRLGIGFYASVLESAYAKFEQ
jgi:hypothetical protein